MPELTRDDYDGEWSDTPNKSTSPRPVTEQTRSEVARLHGMGLGRNEIARELGVAAGTVTKIAKEADPPLQFDRAATALAVRARQLDLAAARADISRMLLVRAQEALEAMDAPTLVYSFGGKENEYNDRLLDVAPAADQRNLMTIAAIAVQRHAELVKIDGDGAQVEVDSVIGSLASGFDAAAAALRASAGASADVVGADESE